MQVGYHHHLESNLHVITFSGEREDRKGVSGWSVHSNMAQESTKLTKDSTNNLVDLKKSENVSSCRLFGFDLKVAPKGDNIISEVSPSAERHELAGISDKKLNPLSKDCIGVQNKQSTLSRSRTKVHLPLQIIQLY